MKFDGPLRPDSPINFETPVASGGYAWWYLDAMSDDGRYGLTLIAFIGSVFSPYYARARRRDNGVADPLNHCALNVALYASPGTASPAAWAMTERARAAVQRSASQLRIGPSAMEWDGNVLTVHIDEITVPWAKRLRGRVRLHPAAVHSHDYPLDATSRHHWCPIAPCARVEVELEEPALRWSGPGYLDSNRGQRPLEQDFTRWDWSRAALSQRRSAVLYDATRSDASAVSLALAFDPHGRVESFSPPPSVALPSTGWRVCRNTRSDAPAATRVQQTLEDGPFYARSVVNTHLLGERATAMHESLSLRRWAMPAVQMMLPFRMPRRG